MNAFKIGFIGLGLIGGSVAKSIHRIFPNYTIIGYDVNTVTLKEAQADGTLDHYTTNISDIADCDYVFLCAPVHYNIEYLKTLKPLISDSCILSDVGSVKSDIYDAVKELGLGSHFIGGHPMVGSERSGYDAATDRLIENAYYFITPSPDAPADRVEEFMTFIGDLGAIPIRYSPDEHDKITSYISHVPHVIAASLVNLVRHADSPDGIFKSLAAGGFKDITRIASSSPVMWQQICLENRSMISKVLDEYIRLIVQAKCWVDNGDADEIYNMFSNSREYRNSLPEASKGVIEKIYAFYCDIYDEAGGIATIATLLAMNSISIKNIGIIHNREFEEGVLRIEFYDEESCVKAQGVLKERNYTLHIR